MDEDWSKLVAIEPRSIPVKAGSLLLDPKNARIPADRRSDNQRQLLHALLAHEDVKGLAASIAKLGLFPNEKLVVIPRGRRYIVLEGNRRLAAIRLLLSPEQAPTPALVKHFRRLSSKTDLAALGKIDVAVMPDRLTAAPIIAALHIGAGKRRWSSLQQARYYAELVAEGLSPEEVADRVGVSLAQIRSFLRTEKLYRIALTLDLPESIAGPVDDSQFPLTTLERFIESKTARSFLGIELDEKSGFVGKVHPDRFKAVLKHVVTDIVTTKSMTRKVHGEDEFKAYVAEAEKKLPETRKRGAFDPDTLLGPTSSTNYTDEPVELTSRPRQRTLKPSSSIVPRGFVCRPRVEKVGALFKELKTLKLVDHRNTTGVMLRVLLDVALWSYYKQVGRDKDVCRHFDPNGKRRQNNPLWTPPLRDLISYGVEKMIFDGMTADGYKSVRTLAAKDSTYFITIDGFNEFTHNPNVTPTEGDLRALWARAEPMLEIILN